MWILYCGITNGQCNPLRDYFRNYNLPFLSNTHTILYSNPQSQQIGRTPSPSSTISFDPAQSFIDDDMLVLPSLSSTLHSNPQNQQISRTLSLPSTISMMFDPPQPLFIDSIDDILTSLLNTHMILYSNPQNQQISRTLSLPSMMFDPPQPLFVDDDDNDDDDDDDYDDDDYEYDDDDDDDDDDDNDDDDDDDNDNGEMLPSSMISMSDILKNPLSVPYLFQCFQEAQDNLSCEILSY